MNIAIVTGFEVFGNYAVNPTEIVARYLDGGVLAGHRIHSMVFPTTVLVPHGTVDYGRKIVEACLALNASVIISLGMASEAKGVRFERRCRNWVGGKYCTPLENGKPVSSTHPLNEGLLMPLQLWNFAESWERFSMAKIPFEASDDAGTYCCNALMYRTLRAMQELKVEIPFAFVHVPCTEEAIVHIPDFDRKNKVLVRQEDLVTIVKMLLESYPF